MARKVCMMLLSIKRRVAEPVARLLSQGMPPRRIALSMAVALCVSAIPVLGVTTALCFAAAFAFRLNIAVMQAVNWLATPLQIALLVPFYSAGAHVFGLADTMSSADAIAASFRESPAGFFSEMWKQTLAGSAIWLVVSLPATFLFAKLFHLAIDRLFLRQPRLGIHGSLQPGEGV